MSERARIGFIGLGVMGGRMAATLARAGHSLAVHDVDRAKVGALAAAGAAACASPKEVAQRSEIVFSSLPLPATVRSVYLGPDGVLEGARPGTVLRGHEHGGPGDDPRGQRGGRRRGVQYLDAPVSGGYREAETGALVLIVGGDREAFDRVRDVLAVLGPSIHYAGPSGAGNVVKLVNNVMSMGNVLVAAEAFVLGVRRGDGAAAAARDPPHERRPLVPLREAVPQHPGPGLRAGLHGGPGPQGPGPGRGHGAQPRRPGAATSLLHQLYNACAALGEGQSDFAAIVKLFESWARTEVKGA